MAGRRKTAALHRLDARLMAASYDAHAAAVYGLAERVTCNAEVAARLTEEVFAQLRFVSVEDGVTGLRSCLLTDVHRRAVAWTRSHAPQQTVTTLPFEPFATLPADEQTVVSEAYFGGKTYDEVARILNREREEVARLMQSALRRLGVATPLSPRLLGAPQAI